MRKEKVTMKKFGKFLFGTISLAALAGGVFYFFKNVVNKKSSDDFEDFEDDLDDFDDLDDIDTDDSEDSESSTDAREYVTINLTEEKSDSTDEEDSDAFAEDEEVRTEA
jgi:hypothetical protein